MAALRGMISAGMIVVGLILTTPVSAQVPTGSSAPSEWTPRQKEIMRIVMSAEGGYLTKEMHTEFWQPVVLQYGKVTASVSARIKAALDESIGMATGFQRETWASVAASAREKKVVFTPGYAAARQKVESYSNSNLPVEAKAIKQAVESGDRLIRAAASGEPISARGQTFYVKEELAVRVLEGLDGAMARASRLISPDWSENSVRKEHEYQDLGLKLLSDEPFKRGEDTYIVSGKPIKINSLSRDLNSSEHMGLAVTRLLGKLSTATIIDEVTNAGLKSLEGIGASQVGSTQIVPFRGVPSALVNGKTVSDGQVLWISLRTFYREGRTEMLQLLAITTDMLKATGLRESMENDLKLIE
jgi:hypothetical protein